MIERETKTRVDDLDVVRERLKVLGATLQHAVSMERNTLFDRGEELHAEGCVLRVRCDGQGYRVTFKGPATFSGAVKQRTELETTVGDADTFTEVLVALGYRAIRTYEKKREEWSFDGSSIALDLTPIGSFVEVEGLDPEGVLDRLELRHIEPESLSYLGLWAQAREADSDLPRDMIFSSASEAVSSEPDGGSG